MTFENVMFGIAVLLLGATIIVGSSEVRKFRKLTGERHWVTGILGLTWFFRE